VELRLLWVTMFRFDDVRDSYCEIGLRSEVCACVIAGAGKRLAGWSNCHLYCSGF
jgi:hypothetical protein